MRNTGKTFRILMEALKRASEGEKVALECQSMHMADYTFSKARDIANVFMKPESPEPRVLKIGSGEIRFTSKRNTPSRGTRGVSYLHDLF